MSNNEKFDDNKFRKIRSFVSYDWLTSYSQLYLIENLVEFELQEIFSKYKMKIYVHIQTHECIF